MVDPVSDFTDDLEPRVSRYRLRDDEKYFGNLRFWWLIVWGVIVPPVFLLAAMMHRNYDLWQSETFSTFALLLFRARSMAWLLPLVLLSTVALGIETFRDPKTKPSLLVWLGVPAGAVLWLEIYVAWCGAVSHEIGEYAWIAISIFVSLIVGFGGVIAAMTLSLVVISIRNGKGFAWSILLTILLVMAIGMAPVTFVVGIVILVCATPLAVSAYASATFKLFKSRKDRWRISLSAILLIFTWLSANFAAWRLAILAAIEEYNRLPTEQPPNCFIVTASAHGHAGLVGSRQVGQAFPVNRQLQRFKAAEIVLAYTLPRTHRRLRVAYNRCGPPLARTIRNEWLSDATYVLLKPVEWLLRLALLSVAAIPRQAIDGIYAIEAPSVTLPSPSPQRADHDADNEQPRSTGDDHKQ